MEEVKKISRSPGVYLLEGVILCLVLGSFILVSLVYHTLPEKIANHFTFSGLPDAYSKKSIIWMLPVFSGMIYSVLLMLGFFIRFMKREDTVTLDVLQSIMKMFRLLRLIFAILVVYLVIGTIRISSGEAKGLGAAVTPVFLLTLLIVLVVCIREIALRQRKAKN